MSAVLKAAAPGREALSLSHLDGLESEAIHIMRKVVAGVENPALLFSGGADSIVMLRIAEKAFRPDRFPFPLLHIDTEHNIPEIVAFRDARVAELGERLIVRSVGDSIRAGRVKPRRPAESRIPHMAVTLLDAVNEFGFDALFDGSRLAAGEPLRVCPLSSWTDFHIGRYIAREALAMPRIPYAHPVSETADG